MEKEEHELNAMLTDELDISLLQGMRAKKSGLLELDSNCGRNMTLSDKDFKYLFRRAMPGVDPRNLQDLETTALMVWTWQTLKFEQKGQSTRQSLPYQHRWRRQRRRKRSVRRHSAKKLGMSHLFLQSCRPSAPAKGMSNLVRVLAERLQLIEGGEFPACKRKVLRRFQVVCIREIARNGAKAMHEHRVEICKERRRKHNAAAAPAPVQDLMSNRYLALGRG